MNLGLKTIALCAALCFSANLYAGGAADVIQAKDALARAVPSTQPNSAAYVTLTNTSDENHALVSAESDASKVVELHTHIMDEGMMKMRRVEKIDLPAGQTVKLEPGGLHVMLIGLKQPLNSGENVEVTLVYEDGSRKTLTAPVQKVMAKHQKNHH